MTPTAVISDQWIVASEERPTKGLLVPWIWACADYLGTRKVLGERAECAFAWQAMEHGLIVSKPYGDSAPYDFIVGSRWSSVPSTSSGQAKNGRRPGGRRRSALGRRPKAKSQLWKVQVKSVQGKDPQGRYSVNLRKSFSRRYERGEIDFFAVWIAGAATWYIVPGREVFPSKGGHFYPDVRASRGKYEKYREAWELLGAGD